MMKKRFFLLLLSSLVCLGSLQAQNKATQLKSPCDTIDPYKISFMGSSVCNGYGAKDYHGYAYQFSQILQERAASGSAPFYRSNISVNGDNTVKVLKRYDDLINDCGKYVVYGLSLGNEGIHEQGQKAFDQFRKNIKILIDKARAAGKIPVVTNNYARADFNAADYEFTKRLNLIIAQWDVPSVNLLGAIDNGKGQWAKGYEFNAFHPNYKGYQEMSYAFVPSLFDALAEGKAEPNWVKHSAFRPSVNSKMALLFKPDNIVHSFTVSVEIKTHDEGAFLEFTTQQKDSGKLVIKADGITYQSPGAAAIATNKKINDGHWHTITITHYDAWGVTMLYVDGNKLGITKERLQPEQFLLHGGQAPSKIAYRDWLFYRSGMDAREIVAIHEHKMLKSSLELYAPLFSKGKFAKTPFVNLARSTNVIHQFHLN